jgi:methionyl-tRNA formyltransferase
VIGGPAVRTVFFGSGAFAVPILEALLASKATELVGVVTAPDRPSGRRAELMPTPVARRARDLDLRILQPERLRAPEAIAAIAALQPELGVLADYGQIVPRAILDLPRHGILNVHPSALPRHRGATPIQATIAAGDPLAGVTVMLMDEGLDTGPILSQATWMLEGTERAPDLEAEAARRGADLLLRSLDEWLQGKAQLSDQAAAEESMTRPFRREDARLDWARPAVELERQVRANAPWPGAFIETTQGRLGVIAARVAESQPGDVPGRIVRHGDRIALATADGRLVFEGVQLAGRRAMTGEDFLRGRPGIVGTMVSAGD